MTETAQTRATATAALRSTMTGQVFGPADAGYDTARRVWNGDIDRRPAVIARCGSVTDVTAAIRHAREHGLEIAVRGGGHSAWGASTCDDGLVIDLSPLCRVRVDPVIRRVRVGGGASLAQLDAATQAHGLAVPAGTVSHTGVGGLTLGGGFGWLTNRAGLSIDNLTSAQVVLADGRVVRASPDEHPELFWGLRGGGGNFGVVTEFEFAAHPVGPLVQLGLLFWPVHQAAEALRIGRDVLAGLPRSAGGMLAALNAPPAPFVPEAHHLTPGVALVIAGFADPDALAALLAPARAAAPLFEYLTTLPHTGLQQMLDDTAPWGVRAYTKGIFLDELPDPAIAVLAAHLPAKSSPMTLVAIVSIGGAFADVPDEATAFAGRRSTRFAIGIDALAHDAEPLAADRAWARSLYDALRPFSPDGAAYVNFMGEPDQAWVRASYGPKYPRLARIKATYDPDNLFHRNPNITPTH
ncbi:MAG: FAD-binding oxidoreductase [Pseudonocardiaceae bacterium]